VTTQVRTIQIEARPRKKKYKFVIGGLLIVAALIYLIATTTMNSAQYYMTVNELLESEKALSGRPVRVSGAVVGETVQYDPNTLELRFTIAHMPDSPSELAAGGLAEALREAVSDPNAQRLEVVYVGPKPDLLKNEAAAILTGTLGDDGVFYATEVLFKCPTRYDEAPPDLES